MKMHLKNRAKSSFKKKLVVSFIIIAIFLYLFFLLSKNISYYYLNYSIKEARRVINLSVGDALTKDFLNNIKSKELYEVSKNSKEEIEMVDYDSYLVNLFLKEVSDNITNALEKEELSANNIAFYIPLGSFLKHPLLNDKGPKIPVRMEMIGSVMTNVKTKVTEYGINNCLIEMYVHVEIKEKVMLPVITKTITVSNDIPISYKIISGSIPSYYGSSLNKESGIYSIPME